jgi:drug/metabolite transporter (DMT)-like permease
MVYLKLVLTMLFWGGTFIAGRVAAQEIGPLTAAAGRFAFASLLLMVILRVRASGWPKLTRREALLILGTALTGVVGYNIAFFLGLRQITASRASLIIALNPVFITLASGVVFRERLPRAGLAGVLLSLVGAGLVITRGNWQNLELGFGPGELFISLCVVLWVSYTLIGRVVLRTLTPLISTTYASMLGCAGLLIPAFLLERSTWTIPSPSLILALAYLGLFGTVLGFIWYYDALRELGPAQAGIFINLVPVFAVLLGVLILGEGITLQTLLGGVLVVLGVTLTNAVRHRSHPGYPGLTVRLPAGRKGL